jgi:uncharacterized protein YheU (UPF0270 family)
VGLTQFSQGVWTCRFTYDGRANGNHNLSITFLQPKKPSSNQRFHGGNVVISYSSERCNGTFSSLAYSEFLNLEIIEEDQKKGTAKIKFSTKMSNGGSLLAKGPDAFEILNIEDGEANLVWSEDSEEL